LEACQFTVWKRETVNVANLCFLGYILATVCDPRGLLQLVSSNAEHIVLVDVLWIPRGILLEVAT
jgi:hypothetical protein